MFYIPVVFSDSFPWSLFLVAAAVRLVARSGAPRQPSRTTASASARCCGCGSSVIVGVLLAVGGEAGPLHLSDRAGGGRAGRLRARPGHRRGRGPAAVAATDRLAIMAASCSCSASGLLYLFRDRRAPPTRSTAWRQSGASGCWPAPPRSGSRRGNGCSPPPLSLAASFVALNGVFVLRTLPSFEAYKPVPGFARRSAGGSSPADVVATYNQALPSLVFYLRRHVEELFDAERCSSTCGARGSTLSSVMSAERLRDACEAGCPASCVIERRPTFDVRLENVLARAAAAGAGAGHDQVWGGIDAAGLPASGLVPSVHGRRRPNLPEPTAPAARIEPCRCAASELPAVAGPDRAQPTTMPAARMAVPSPARRWRPSLSVLRRGRYGIAGAGHAEQTIACLGRA